MTMTEGCLTPGDPLYPDALRTIPDPPKTLYYRGDLSLLARPMVAVVGTRKPSPYGVRITKRIAGQIAGAGAVLVSGLAMGIDSVGHRRSLELGGRTIAVLGQGLDIYYPKSNRDLQEEIGRSGLLLSEYPAGTKPARFTFPRRNRIISGLALATMVTEAGVNSGSLITAEWAENQGRPVYCVPGNIDSQCSLGTNLLISDGAVPLVVTDHLLRDLGLVPGGFVSKGRVPGGAGPPNRPLTPTRCPVFRPRRSASWA